MSINENLSLGIDLGIGSIGWGVLDHGAALADPAADGDIPGVGVV